MDITLQECLLYFSKFNNDLTFSLLLIKVSLVNLNKIKS